MKIAFFVTRFPSLSQTFILNQITGLIDHGHEVEIYARRKGDDPKVHENVIKYDLLRRTHCLIKIPQNRFSRMVSGFGLIGKYSPRNLASIFNSLNFFKYGIPSISLNLLFHTIPFLKKNKFDIIYCHFGPNGALAVELREAGVISGKIVTVFHGFDLTSYLSKFDEMPYKELFKKGDLFHPISKRWESKLIELGCSSKKISTHRMGIDTDKIALSTNRKTSKRRVNLLSVARLVEKKGIEFGIQAVSTVIKKFPNIEYLIIGDGPLKTELLNHIDRLEMNRNIKIMGWMDQGETFAFMRQADIFLAPSVTSADGDQEGIPVVLMEAMAHGLAVISTHHSGIPELVVDQKTGLLVDERDSGALARKIEFLIANPDKLVKLGTEGRKAVEADYNIRILNDDLVKTFHQLGLPKK